MPKALGPSEYWLLVPDIRIKGFICPWYCNVTYVTPAQNLLCCHISIVPGQPPVYYFSFIKTWAAGNMYMQATNFMLKIIHTDVEYSSL